MPACSNYLFNCLFMQTIDIDWRSIIIFYSVLTRLSLVFSPSLLLFAAAFSFFNILISYYLVSRPPNVADWLRRRLCSLRKLIIDSQLLWLTWRLNISFFKSGTCYSLRAVDLTGRFVELSSSKYLFSFKDRHLMKIIARFPIF